MDRAIYTSFSGVIISLPTLTLYPVACVSMLLGFGVAFVILILIQVAKQEIINTTNRY